MPHKLLKVWDSKGLLFLAFEPKGKKDLTRVFAATKNESSRQVVERWRAEGGSEAELQAHRAMHAFSAPALRFDPDAQVWGAFRSLYQGDHVGVEFSTKAHSELLQRASLLGEGDRLCPRGPLRGPDHGSPSDS